MICCCAKDSSKNYTLADTKDSNATNAVQGATAPTTASNRNSASDTAPRASIHTGNGALSSSSQNIPGEAQLDKGTVSAATEQKREPVTEQPASLSSNEIDRNSVSNSYKISSDYNKKPEETNTPKAESIVIESNKRSESVVSYQSNPPIESHIVAYESPVLSDSNPVVVAPHTSVIEIKSTKASTSISSSSSNSAVAEELTSVLSDLDRLEASVSAAEKLPGAQQKVQSSEVATQLQTLNSQVN